jgi:Putative addiction module component
MIQKSGSDPNQTQNRGLTPISHYNRCMLEKPFKSVEIDPEVEDTWAAEVERRNPELENGSVSVIPGPEAVAKLKAEFG